MIENSLAEALKVAAEGWPVFPLAPWSKVPAAGSHGFKDATTDPVRIRELWEDNEHANIGVWTRDVVAIDLDTPKKEGDPSGWSEWYTIKTKHASDLPPSTREHRTPRNGRHLIYRARADHPVTATTKAVIDGVSRPCIDLRGSGGYVLWPPSRTRDGSYEVMAGAGWGPERVFEVPVWAVRGRLSPGLNPVEPGTQPSGGGSTDVPRGTSPNGQPALDDDGQPFDPDRVEAAARHLVAQQPEWVNDRDLWYRLGFVLFDVLGPARGAPLFDELSRLSPKYGDVGKVWKSFVDGSYVGTKFTARSLLYQACAQGWDPVDTTDDVGRYSGRIEVLEVAPVDAAPRAGRPGPLHPEIIYQEGPIGDAVRWIELCSHVPQPELALAATLSMFGAVMSPAFLLEGWNTRTNLWVAALAPTGEGKDAPMQAIHEVMESGGLTHLVGPSDFTSESGFMHAMQERDGRMLEVTDEIGAHQRQMGAARADSPLAGLLTVKMHAYTGKRTLIPRGYSKASRTKEEYAELMRAVRWPAYSVYGTGVAEPFYASFGADCLHNGHLNRQLVFQVGCGASRNREVSLQAPPQSVLDLLTHLDCINQEFHAILKARKSTHLGPPPFAKVALGQGVVDQYERLDAEFSGHPETSAARSVWVRAGEKILKLAMIRAVVRDPLHPTMNILDMDWAEWLVRNSTAWQFYQVDRSVAGSVEEAKVKRVMRVIDDHEGPILWSVLLRRSNMLVKELRPIVGTLVETGQVTETLSQGPKGRPGKRYERRT